MNRYQFIKGILCGHGVSATDDGDDGSMKTTAEIKDVVSTVDDRPHRRERLNSRRSSK